MTRESNIFWVNFSKPPKKAKQIWLHFLKTHVAPYVSSTMMEWNTEAQPNYTAKYFSTPDNTVLYHRSQGQYTSHTKLGNSGKCGPTYYITAQPVTLPVSEQETIEPVDVLVQKTHIQLISKMSQTFQMNRKKMTGTKTPLQNYMMHYLNPSNVSVARCLYHQTEEHY
jgi:hypothetical protein